MELSKLLCLFFLTSASVLQPLRTAFQTSEEGLCVSYRGRECQWRGGGSTQNGELFLDELSLQLVNHGFLLRVVGACTTLQFPACKVLILMLDRWKRSDEKEVRSLLLGGH